jgi:hypothetical protein
LVTKRGKNIGAKMCQFWVERPLQVREVQSDEGEDLEQIVCFPDEFLRYGSLIQQDAPVFARIEKLGGDSSGVSLRQLIRLDGKRGDEE